MAAFATVITRSFGKAMLVLIASIVGCVWMNAATAAEGLSRELIATGIWPLIFAGLLLSLAYKTLETVREYDGARWQIAPQPLPTVLQDVQVVLKRGQRWR